MNRLPQAADLTDAFQRGHYTHWHLMPMLSAHLGVEVTEPVFWALYAAGRILPGVSLMGLIDQPLLVWPRADVDQWFSAGCPGNTEQIDRERRVRAALADAGIPVPDFTFPSPAELN